MSNSPDDKDGWSQHSASLFRDARRAHDPTPLERARLDALLARIQAADPEALLAAKHASDAAARGTGALLRQISKVSLAVVCVAAVAIPFIRSSRQPSEPVRDAQPGSSAHASSATPAALPSNATPSALPQIPEAPADRESTPPRSQRRRSGTTTEVRRASHVNLIDLPEASSPAPEAAPARPPAPSNGSAASPAAATRQSSLRATSAEQTAREAAVAPATREQEAAVAPAAREQEAAVAPAAREQEAAVAPVAREQEAAVAPVVREADQAAPQPAPPSELALLKRMHAALRDADYSTVMTLCAEHERRWPHGVFELEREGVRAIAACAAKSDGAIPQAKRFLASHPRAPIAMRVSSACVPRLPR